MRILELTKDELSSPIGVIPVGSIEQHGPHLPLGTDSMIAEAVAEKVAQIEGLLLFPTVYYGCSVEHGDLPQVSIGDVNFLNMMGDILESSVKLNIKGLVLVNGHGGNTDLLKVVTRRVNFTRPRPKVMLVDLHEIGIFSQYRDLHAGTVETSLLLYLRPELVRLDRIPSNISFSPFTFTLITSEKGGSNGVVAEKVEPSKELGERVFKEMINFVMNRVKEFRSVIT
ncbi:Creatininase [Metallosphaera sedula]|uniref:Creatininase n=3 Tax=Metallosphaera TaxID=41980 RepID=A4YGL2_METS5|nr:MULTISPECIES: creatininase family protein [Metallosphaera]ABP95564.1 Creatininase [Metallosphaera sedula DSM 5348]AIM27548.1 Creatininase [Metallosphaera sedula]AKV74410.1 creatininase [Metallosphaera sedula]AKV76649.1 creatininase [Metallosphaera sedula]AKV78901.1 creatininase [Metallosphaera sedula]